MDGYVLHERLGTGAHAEVWRGEAVGRPGRVVAIKRFAGTAARDTVAQVRREAEALARLSHPSIVRLLDVPTDDDGAALVTPFLPGGTLADRIARGPLPPAAVADLGARLGDALSAAHGAGVVHADVKPANVIFDAEEQPLLTDFGAAFLRGRTGDDVHGTATYLAPEVADGTTPPTPASDQYALGVTLYEALAGVPPYAAPTVAATIRAAARGVHLPLADLAEDLPPEAAAAIERALARDPAARWPNVRELASRLEEVRTSLPSWSLPPPTGPVTASPPPAAEPPRAMAPPPSSSPATPPAVAPLASSGGSPGGSPGGSSGGSSGGDPSMTRRFGPAPPLPAEERSRATRRAPLLIGAAAVILVPLAIVLALLLSDRGGADDRGLATVPTASPSPDATVEDLPRCEDAAQLPPDTPEVVPADTEGRGCTLDLGWDPDARVLTVPRAADSPLRFELGEPGDRLLVGDWNCDGRQSPGLYRPGTGEVFTFDGFAGEGGSLDSGPPRPTGMLDGEPFVVAGDGEDVCDRIEVRGDA